MVKLGEVEYLVKFDTISKSFGDVLRDALGDDGLFDTEDIENRLDKIDGHLGLLVTPFSGDRMVDLIKIEGHLAQLENPEWIEKKIEAIASNTTLLEKFGIKAERGTEEAEEEIKEKFELFRRDIADFMKVTMSSDPAYFKNFQTLVDIVSLLTSSTEGRQAYLIETVMNKLKIEKKVDEAVYKWLRDEMGVDIPNVVQRLWDQLSKDVISSTGDDVVETHQDFLDMLGEKLVGRDKLREEIFHGDPTKPSAELIEFIKEELSDISFMGGLQVPRVFRKGLEQARGLEEKELYDVKLSNIKSDVKFIVTELDKIEPILEMMGKDLKEQDLEKLIKRVKTAVGEHGWYYLFSESKVFGDERKLAKERKKMMAGAAEELLTVGEWGPKFSGMPELISAQIPVDEIIEEMKEKSPELIVRMLEEMKEKTELTLKFVKGLGEEFTDKLSEDLANRFEDIIKGVPRTIGG